jgi:phosphatidylserine decarboxylase
MKDALVVSLLSLLPRNRLARLMGVLARTGFSTWFTRLFVAFYKVNLDEAVTPESGFKSLEQLFTRALKPGLRPIDPDPTVMVSPVDGRVAAVGTTVDGKIAIAPGRMLDIAALLGRPLTEAQTVTVLYLSPQDYHRVHTPLQCNATHWSYRAGTLWPVFPGAVQRVNNLFSKNERMIFSLPNENGPLDLVMVGAFGVGRISSDLTPVISNTGTKSAEGLLAPPTPLAAGAELGKFHLGSTVVLISPKGRWNMTINVGDIVRLGYQIAKPYSAASPPT